MFRHQCFVVALLAAFAVSRAQGETLHEFNTIVLSEEFCSEGACAADIDGDGETDIISGPYWYRGPDFRNRYRYADSKRYPIRGYSDFFFTFAGDFNHDGRTDLLAIGTPGEAAYWFENPLFHQQTDRLRDRPWKRHLAIDRVSNESPVMADITGDGRDELIFLRDGAFVCAQPLPDRPWRIIPLTTDQGLGRFTHGLGVGDVNGDGRKDLLETRGWWEQPQESRALFRFHRQPFSQTGGAQMFAVDLDGDGDNDVVSTQNAHGYGLSWFEQRESKGEIIFREHPILTENWQDNDYGVAISQMHALAVADIDSDGVDDIITGKRFWAHGGRDPGAREAVVLYWLRTVRTSDGVRFEPWLLDKRSGVGTQLTVTDVTGNGLLDIVVGNKLGTFATFHSKREIPTERWKQIHPKPRRKPAHVVGTNLFNQNVRTTEPLQPVEEKSGFYLPNGFRIDLVASEPTIGQPMNLAFDAKGRLWVSSSLEYPFGSSNGATGRDRITLFEDTDQDGQFETSKVFADGLNIPIGLLPYGNGVICFSIPNIWYLEDTDGDDRADKRSVLYGPFDTTRDTHGMCNSFTLAADGWIYACHGFNNRSTVRGADGHEVTMHSGNVFRFRPDGSRIELFAHGQVNPFGLAIDKFGDILTADCHTKPINLLMRRGYHDSFGKPHDGLGYVPNVMEHLHGSTGIGGIALGEDTNFPDIYRDSSFGCNVVTSRVNRNRLTRRGSSLIAIEEPDFLTAEDPWFRPVFNIVGPDGALYVADFYNAIIGHYEVDLHHPRRDRKMGRVWKISFATSSHRRDSGSAKPLARVDFSTASLQTLVAELASENGWRNRMAIEQIAERFPDESNAIRAYASGATGRQKANLLWCLFRLGSLSIADVEQATRDESIVVRAHAFRILEAFPWSAGVPDLLATGLSDPEPLVRRIAAIAAVTHQDESLIRPLMAAHLESAGSDVHLRHATKMAIGYHLKNESWLQQLIANELSSEEKDVVASVTPFLRSKTSAAFLVDYLWDTRPSEKHMLRTWLPLAVQQVDEMAAERLVQLIRSRFADDRELQLELLDRMRESLQAEAKELPAVVKRLAAEIAKELFRIPPGESLQPIGWTFHALKGGGSDENPWQVSTRRKCSDGADRVPLWSSFPLGETRTGIYRSQPFVLPDSISFYLAGHDGPPGQEIRNRNFVRLIDASTLAVLKQEQPKRNDVAQLVQWDTSDVAGRRAFVELVDGNSETAYAWVAAGRFSVTGLNPSRIPAKRRRAAQIIADYQLHDLTDLLRNAIPDHVRDGESCRALALAFAETHRDSAVPSSIRRALAEAIGIVHALEARQRIVDVLIEDQIDATEQAISLAMSFSTIADQAKLADTLLVDAEGSKLLWNLIQRGVASQTLLADEKRRVALARFLSTDEIEAVERLSPPEDDAIEQVTRRIAVYRAEFTSRGGQQDKGKQVFEKQCAVCHRVANIGKNFAPNLDGIGNRGLNRLLEDILDPNRNVDVAFRAQTIVTTDGRVFNGLVKEQTADQLHLIESNGNERFLKTADIEEAIATSLSPMPSNFDDVLKPEELRNLLAYLLSLAAD